MSKKKLSDKEIADGILVEVELSMQRIQDAHDKASMQGELKSDAYSRMQGEGLWDANKILDEYILIKSKNSCLPSKLLQMIIVIFETASTNFWAKKVAEQRGNGNKKKND